MNSQRIAVVGIGRIGLCLAINLERAGYEVLGIDKSLSYIERIRNKSFETQEPGVQEALAQANRFTACYQLRTLRKFDPAVIFIAVNTADGIDSGYDHAELDRVIAELVLLGKPEKSTDLSVVCTTLPGYCDSKAELTRSGGYALSYTPGFVAQGSILRDQLYPDQVLIGESDAVAGDRLERVFRRMCLNRPAVHRMSRLSAEIAKLATNCALTMKIAFANSIGDLAASAGADPEKILRAVGSDSRIGHGCLQYGFGYGGPCFPRDNRALNFFAKQYAAPLGLAEASDEANRRHLQFQLRQYLNCYPDYEPLVFDSLTYKPGTEILDESQPLELAVQLAHAGRKVIIYESANVLATLQARFGELFEYRIRSSPALS